MRCLILLLILIVIAAGCLPTNRNPVSSINKGPKAVIVDKETIRGFHVSTRPHNRKIIYYSPSGYWFVFYGHGSRDPDGKDRISWRSSEDGINWSQRHTAVEGNPHSSSLDVLLTGDKITALIFRPDYYREQAGIPEMRDGKTWYERNDPFPLPYEIRQYRIKDGNLVPGPIYTVINGTRFKEHAHYGSLTQDTEGFFWVGCRAVKGGEQNPFEAWVTRSRKANDISKWEPHIALFRASSRGTVTVQVVALDGGTVYAVIFSQSDKKIYGSLYDPKTGRWGSPYIVAEGNGKSKRAVASFDPGTKRLHLVCIDNSGALRHKILLSPYREQDWLPGPGDRIPGFMIDSNVVTKEKAGNDISLSIDTSKSPAPLVVAYHKNVPHYRLRWYDGKEWDRKDYPIGMQDPGKHAIEISMIRYFSDKMGLIYGVPSYDKKRVELYFLEIPKVLEKEGHAGIVSGELRSK